MPVSSGQTGDGLAAGLADLEGEMDLEAAVDALTLELRSTLVVTLVVCVRVRLTDDEASRERETDVLAVSERDIDELNDTLAAKL